MIRVLNTETLAVFSAILIFTFYIPLVYLSVKTVMIRRAKADFFRGIISICSSCENDEECVAQFFLIYKRLSEKYSDLKNKFHSATEILEELISLMDTLDENRFKEAYKILPPTNYRNRLINILKIIKFKYPFATVSSKQGNLLAMLKNAVETGNKDLAVNTLNNISDEIEVLEGRLQSQAKKNQVSFIVSAIGVVLTIFFGLISFVSFVK